MSNSKKINVQEIDVTFKVIDNKDYISLTDIAKYRNQIEPFSVINNWLRTRSTIEYLGLWEKLNNLVFKPIEFERFRSESGSNYFTLSPQRWIDETNAIGIISKSGRYGGTFAHKDIAFEFASWISPEFKLYLITEFQRLKDEENDRFQLDWNLQRTLSKINYRIHTDAIKQNLIPKEITKQQVGLVYATEADLLNVALFGVTAKEWREANPDLKGTTKSSTKLNMRDDATIEQLVVLSNLESINALLIQQGLSQGDRLVELNKVAITQMKSLLHNDSIKKLKNTL